MTSYPTMDPELAAAVSMLPSTPFSDLPVARATFDELIAGMLDGLSYDGVTLREVSAPGLGDDPDVTIRLITPDGADAAAPALVFIHGGGFAIGTARSSDPFCLTVARALGVVVANVEYRLAPETPFPGPLNDCFAALSYVHSHADELGIDSTRIAVGGQSAGGGLAAGTVLKARDEGVPVAFQFLDIPELDDRLQTPSMTTFTDTPMWHRPNAIESWKYYLGESYLGPEDANVSVYAAPSRATDLSGLPPAYVSTMELDPLRDEGILYALALLRAGVSVELHSFPGTFHGSALLEGAAVSRRQAEEAITALARGLRCSVVAS